MIANFKTLVVLLIIGLLAQGIAISDSTTITDIVGNKINISPNISRVVNIDPFTCQFIFIIGAEDKLVGTNIGPSNMSLVKILQPSIAFLPNPGGKNHVNITKLLDLKPELVISDKIYNKSIENIENEGIPVVQIDVETPENLIKSYEIIGKIFGKENETSEFISYYNQKMGLIKNEVASLKDEERKKIYFGQKDIYQTLGDDYYEAQITKIAGGNNVARGYSKGDNKVTIDEIYKWNPDRVVIFSYNSVNLDELKKDQRWQSLPAIRINNIYQMPKYLMCWELPVPESILGTMWLQNLMYPKNVSYNLTNEVKDFYKKFYHINLTYSEIDQILNDHSKTSHLSEK